MKKITLAKKAPTCKTTTSQWGSAVKAPPGQWNTYEVYSEEGRLTTVVNGKVVGLASDAVPSTGHICLQSEGVPVEFRNVRIKRFTPPSRMRNPPPTP